MYVGVLEGIIAFYTTTRSRIEREKQQKQQDNTQQQQQQFFFSRNNEVTGEDIDLPHCGWTFLFGQQQQQQHPPNNYFGLHLHHKSRTARTTVPFVVGGCCRWIYRLGTVFFRQPPNCSVLGESNFSRSGQAGMGTCLSKTGTF